MRNNKIVRWLGQTNPPKNQKQERDVMGDNRIYFNADKEQTINGAPGYGSTFSSYLKK
jgi:hypothetical protein